MATYSYLTMILPARHKTEVINHKEMFFRQLKYVKIYTGTDLSFIVSHYDS